MKTSGTNLDPASSGASFAAFAERFADLDFGKLGFTPKMRKDEFLDALWKLREFKWRHFDFDRLCDKVLALLRQDGDSEPMMRVIHYWIYCAVLELTAGGTAPVDGDVLGTAGEISGIYETIFRRNTTLAGIKLGRFANIQLAVLDEKNLPVKVFDAVSVDQSQEVVTVFEFKFTLTLRKLYQQVIGMDSAKHPHLAVLRTHREFKHVRNLVYFGEVGDEHLTEAIRNSLTSKPSLAQRVRTTDRGFAIKLSLPDVSEFLSDAKTVALAQQIGRPFITPDPESADYKKKIARIETTIGQSLKYLQAQGNGKFDVIIAVSNAPGAEFERLKADVVGISQTGES
jgi:hypothetical protein